MLIKHSNQLSCLLETQQLFLAWTLRRHQQRRIPDDLVRSSLSLERRFKAFLAQRTFQLLYARRTIKLILNVGLAYFRILPCASDWHLPVGIVVVAAGLFGDVGFGVFAFVLYFISGTFGRFFLYGHNGFLFRCLIENKS